MFVVDSADLDGLEAARAELHELLARPSLAGTPLLVLGNKNDLPEALSGVCVCVGGGGGGVHVRVHACMCVGRAGGGSPALPAPSPLTHARLPVTPPHTPPTPTPPTRPPRRAASELIARLDLKSIRDREVAAYSISCKRQSNIDAVLEWLTKKAK